MLWSIFLCYICAFCMQTSVGLNHRIIPTGQVDPSHQHGGLLHYMVSGVHHDAVGHLIGLQA